MNKANIMGVWFDAVTLTQAVDRAVAQIKAGKKGYVVTPNPEIVYAAMEDESFRERVNNASLVLPDGIGIIYAAKILGEKLPGKVAGIDFAAMLMHRMAQEKMRLFLLGAKPGIAEQAAENLKKKYPGLIISGTRDGYFKNDSEAVAAVNAAGGADVMFVCLGAPKQEQFMAKHQEEMHVTLCCGLGGSLDVFAGTVQRAPDLFIKLGLEWFYRLCKEPSRIGRMMKLPLFMLLVIRKKLFGKEK
ncbi:MAG: WecB/TagA/CpsF family glycosyltransferase [Butyricicoccus sp.]